MSKEIFSLIKSFVCFQTFKMTDVEASGSMSDAMINELRARNSNLKKTIQALEEGQRRSHIQNEQLLHQKSTLQEMIGNLCSDGTVTSCTSLRPSPSPRWSADQDVAFSSMIGDGNLS